MDGSKRLSGEHDPARWHAGPRADLYLASRSPRRAALLDQIGVTYRTLAVEVDERAHEAEPAWALVKRLARAKACAGLRQVGPTAGRARVLGADTVVVVDGDVLGKPAGCEDALRQLARLSGRAHEVLTAVALAADQPGLPAGAVRLRLSRSRVWFRVLTEAERHAYWRSGEPADKAGSYAIQGRAAQFITRLEGSYSGVMGLPLFETTALLALGSGAHRPREGSVQSR